MERIFCEIPLKVRIRRFYKLIRILDGQYNTRFVNLKSYQLERKTKHNVVHKSGTMSVSIFDYK